MEILLHSLGLWGRQMKPTETCNDREKPTHSLGPGSCFLFKTCSFNTMDPVETDINNKCMDERPYTETFFVPSPIILKIHKLPIVVWLPSFVIRGIQQCSYTTITIKSSKESLIRHKLLVYLVCFFIFYLFYFGGLEESEIRVNMVVYVGGNQSGVIFL